MVAAMSPIVRVVARITLDWLGVCSHEDRSCLPNLSQIALGCMNIGQPFGWISE